MEKSMLAHNLTTIVPALSLAEALEIPACPASPASSAHMTLVTKRSNRGRLCSSIAMRTGNGRDD
jgi:predicted ATPase with chaperone activity